MAVFLRKSQKTSPGPVRARRGGLGQFARCSQPFTVTLPCRAADISGRCNRSEPLRRRESGGPRLAGSGGTPQFRDCAAGVPAGEGEYLCPVSAPSAARFPFETMTGILYPVPVLKRRIAFSALFSPLRPRSGKSFRRCGRLGPLCGATLLAGYRVDQARWLKPPALCAYVRFESGFPFPMVSRRLFPTLWPSRSLRTGGGGRAPALAAVSRPLSKGDSLRRIWTL